MGKPYFTNAHDLMVALGEAMNLINPVVENHHEKVAYLSYLMACELGLDGHEHLVTVVAALLHDVGALFSEEQAPDLTFELHAHALAAAGAKMMEDLPFFDEVATIVASCQRPWRSGAFLTGQSEIPLASSIIHLADHVSVCLKADVPALNQREAILTCMCGLSGTEHRPEVVEALLAISEREYVWMDLLYHPHELMSLILPVPLSLDRTAELTTVMSRLIDYRSSFTAMHSAGVSASAVRIAELIGLSQDECTMMEIAGNLHDLGKIRTPRAILEKPGRLTDEEFNIIKEHAYFTYRVLSGIEGFSRITEWASLHHEKLNGSGYPFHHVAQQIPLGSRILAVSDIFSAVAEERPYRAGMDRDATIRVLRDNVEAGALSKSVVEVLLDNFDDVNERRDSASRIEGRRYFEALERVSAA